MTKTLIGISITLAAGVLAAGAWVTHAPDGEVAAARAQTEIERLRVTQRLLEVEEVRERQKSALLVARLQREQLAAQTASRIDNAPEVVAARIRRRVMAEAWPSYALVTIAAAGVAVVAFAAIRRVPFRAGELETFVSRRQAAVLAHEAVCLQGLSEQVRAQAFADETLRGRVTAGVTVFAQLARTVRAATHTALPAEQAALPAPESQAASVTFARARQDFRTGDMLLGYDATGAPVYLPLTSFVSCAFGGGSGSGKTSKLRFLVAQLLLQGVKVSILDAHAGNPQSLADSLGNLTRLPNCRLFNPFETAQAVQTMLADVQAAIDAGAPQAVPSVFILDELRPLNRACGDVETLMDRLANEGRKFGAYGVFASQTWEAKMFDKAGSAARDACVLKMAARMPKEQARTLFKDGASARAVAKLAQPEMYADSMTFSGVVNVPFCRRDDLDALRPATQPSATGTAHSVNLSVDTGATPERNVGADVIDFAVSRDTGVTPCVTPEIQAVSGRDTVLDALRDRINSGVKIAEMARDAGVDRPLLSNILSGRRQASEAVSAKLSAYLESREILLDKNAGVSEA